MSLIILFTFRFTCIWYWDVFL